MYRGERLDHSHHFQGSEIMRTKQKAPKDIDEYIAGFPTDVRKILEKIRTTIIKATLTRRGNNQTWHADVHARRQSGSFCYFQKTR